MAAPGDCGIELDTLEEVAPGRWIILVVQVETCEPQVAARTVLQAQVAYVGVSHAHGAGTAGVLDLVAAFFYGVQMVYHRMHAASVHTYVVPGEVELKVHVLVVDSVLRPVRIVCHVDHPVAGTGECCTAQAEQSVQRHG